MFAKGSFRQFAAARKGMKLIVGHGPKRTSTARRHAAARSVEADIGIELSELISWMPGQRTKRHTRVFGDEAALLRVRFKRIGSV